MEKRTVRVTLTVDYAGGTEDLAGIMKHAMQAAIECQALLKGCDNIETPVVDYGLTVIEIAEAPTLEQESPEHCGSDYVLLPDASAWIEVDDRVVYIRRDRQVDGGLLVDVMPVGEEDGVPLGSLALS